MKKENLVKKLKETFYLQNKYNSLLNKEWFKERDLAVDWINTIIDESSEFMNSFNWKWWKDTKDKKLYSPKDKDNILLELVDIYHFIASFIIQTSIIFFSNKIEKEHKYGIINKLNLDLDFSESYLDKIFKLFVDVQKKEKSSEKETFILLQKFLSETINSLYTLNDLIELIRTKNKEKKVEINDFDSLINFYSEVINLNKEEFLDRIFFKKVIRYFVELLYINGYSIEDLIKLYIGKVFLNEYRQLNGYKEGIYKKIWKNGKEDNYNLIEIIKDLNLEDLEKNKLFKEFDKRY